MKTLSAIERVALANHLLEQINNGELSSGTLLRELRKQLFGMNQEQYAKLVGLSRRTLSDIESDKGNPSIDVVNKAFKPVGMELRLGLRNSS